ncbi:hypothetical protein HWV62_845 [Athelia sp. TMB]|nr:hypothetical protein HWV62_845 [Athelia sp. TMB]
MDEYKTAPELPLELVRQIILEAWISASETYSRWETFKSFCLVSKAWRTLVIEAAFQFVIIRDRQEVGRYMQFADTYAQHSGYTVTNTGHHPSPFSDSEVHIHLTGNHHFCAPRRVTYDEMARYRADLAQLLPDVRSLHLFVKESVDWEEIFRIHRPSLKYLYIWYSEPENPPFWGRHGTPRDPVLTVTHLHISRACRGMGRFLQHFPNVTHLRLSAKGHLKSLAPLTQNVATLIIDVPPATMGGKDYTSLVHWNFRAAFNDGLLSPSGKTIIVNTDGNKPAGWETVQELCAQRGIQLRQNVIYDAPLPPWCSGPSLTWERILNDRFHFKGTFDDPLTASRLPPFII